MVDVPTMPPEARGMSSKPTTDLRPCKCGGIPVEVNANNLVFVVRCPDCKTETEYERCAIDAVDAWNTWFGDVANG
jgi:hypothetical protein